MTTGPIRSSGYPAPAGDLADVPPAPSGPAPGTDLATDHMRPAACEASWDNCDGERPHYCDRPIDHRGDHECGCGATARQCGAEYQPERRDPTARIVRCDRVAGHDGDHEELFTTIAWPQTDPTRDAVRIVARRVLAHIIARTEVDQKWEDYPDIGEDDWAAVAADVRRLADRGDVQHEHYEAAYRYLADRADRSAA